MPDSNFQNDLNNEAQLAKCLDQLYPKIFKATNYSIERVYDINKQHRGIDLILRNSEKEYFVDEKAQLDYLNTTLPTFAFELSYLKNHIWHKGWLYDQSKTTDIYFLITNIHFNETSRNRELSHVKITGIYKDKLLNLLSNKGLTESTVFNIEKEIRKHGKHGRHPIKALDYKSEGVLFLSKNNKSEQPINLVLKLDYLIKENVGKTIYQL